MLESYEDIRSRIPEEPQWWDEHGVPRYAPFHPRHCANIYADEAVLLLIACQNCRALFRVAMSFHSVPRRAEVGLVLAEHIKNGTIHYGDPPNTGCCDPGASMNCEDLAVLEYWRRSKFEWEREPGLERTLETVRDV